jgi:hypothetical protein
MAARLDHLWLIEAARFDKHKIRMLLGPGKQRRTALWAKLSCDFPSAVGDGRVTFDFAADNTQFICL